MYILSDHCSIQSFIPIIYFIYIFLFTVNSRSHDKLILLDNQNSPISPLILLQMMSQAQGQHRDLIQSIEGLPAAPGLSPLDQDLLMLKATSMATMNCLNECLHILHLQQVARQRGSLGGERLSHRVRPSR